MIRGDDRARFGSYVDFDGPVPATRPDLGPCHVWVGGARSTRGYGRILMGGRVVTAHRWNYEQKVGPVPDGLQLDHLCDNVSCVNEAHLEPTTGKINTLRGSGPTAVNAAKTHCKWGHEFTPENTYRHSGGGRRCAACHARRRQERRAKKRLFLEQSE